MVFHETSIATPHTPDSALHDAMSWLGRTPVGFVHTALLTMPGRLHRDQESSLWEELARVLDPDTGSLWIWGQTGWRFASTFEHAIVTGDLTHAWTAWGRPALDSDVHVPPITQLSREFPPSLVEFCIRSTGQRPGRIILDVFPRAPHLSTSIGASIGARVLSVAPVSDLYTADPTAGNAAPSWVRDSALHDRFFKSLKKQGNCLIFDSKPHVSGYARLRILGREWYAHHASWMLSHRRAIPQGIPVLHASCPDRRCCRPEHLRLGSTANNLDERWVGRRKDQ